MRFKGEAASDPNTTFPEGDYFLRCDAVQSLDKAGLPLTSKKGNEMWILELSVAEGPHKNRKLWHYLVFLLAGAPGHGMTLKAIKAFGIDPEGDNDILPEHLQGVTVKAKVSIEEQDGFEPKNRIARWYTPGEFRKVGVDPGSAQEPAENNGDASFNPAEIEKPAKPAAPKKKPLWGKK